nr:PREDICTED: protein CCSMST1 [Latimeria chalumnae]|eukprot:XP_006010232.1 PREDICTED: protein CCSMST1 [Latimeria chalumnae]
MLVSRRVLLAVLHKNCTLYSVLFPEKGWPRICASNGLSTTPADDKRSQSSNAEEENLGPIKFSTSRASHRVWTVERSLGSDHKKPWWKVLPVSFLGIGFLIWCIFRKETEIDEQLEKSLYEQLPGFYFKPATIAVAQQDKKPQANEDT